MHGLFAASIKTSGILWIDDATVLAPGAVAPPVNMTFTRPDAVLCATVQTGTSTLTPPIAADTPRAGRRLTSDSVGRLNEETRANWFSFSHDFLIDHSPGAADVYTAGFASPDGTVRAVRAEVAAGGLSKFINDPGVSNAVAFSIWMQQGPGTGDYQVVAYLIANTPPGVAIAGTAVPAWQRYSLVAPGVAWSPHAVPVEGRDASLIGGVGPGNRDVVLDIVQAEDGPFITEAIENNGGPPVTRAGERYFFASAAPYVLAGRFALSVSVRPKGATADYVVVRLWTSGPDFAEIDSAGVITVSIGGVTNTTAPIAWSQYDSLDVYVAAGGGLPTDIFYRVNFGAPITPAIAGAALGNVNTAGALTLLADAASAKQFTAWVTNMTIFK